MKSSTFPFLPRVAVFGLIMAGCDASPTSAVPDASPAPAPGDARNLAEVSVTRKATVVDFMARIQKGLPSGWKAGFSEMSGTVTVEKAKPPLMAPEGIPNPVPRDKNAPEEVREPVPLRFSFRVLVLKTPKEYQAIEAKNSELNKAIDAQLAKIKALGTSPVAIPPAHFSPRTPEQREAVGAYEALEKQVVALPDYIYKDIVVEWSDETAKYDVSRLIDKSQTKECQQVRKAITNLLSPFTLKK